MGEQLAHAISATELAPGQMVRLELNGHRILLANSDGDFLAVENNCSHEDVPLHLGCLEGDRIRCSLHGSRFDLKTGQPLDEPADEPIRTYETRQIDGEVWILLD
jgi:3-phenylpropionate/trans-cinnamate dioxygenase ferredoxin subunit